MPVRNYLNEAVGVLLTARRRAELNRFPTEILYNIECVIRAISIVADQVAKENRRHESKKVEAKIKAYQHKIKTHFNFRAKSKKKAIKAKPQKKKRTRKIAA